MRRAAFVVLALAAAAGACQALAGIGDETFSVQDASAPPPTSTMDAATPAPPDDCVHALPPAPPEAGTGGGDSLGAFVLVIDEVRFDGQNDAGNIGYDLDGVCTCFAGNTAHGGASSCVTPGDTPRCDEPGGVDNAVVPLFRTATVAIPSVGAAIDLQSKAIHCGRQAMVFVLSNYNGQANDELVTLGTFISWGLFDEDDAGTPIVNDPICGDASLTQQGGGHDRWSHPSGAFEGSLDNPQANKSVTGYVSNYELVVPLTGLSPLAFSFGGNEVDLATGTLTARLVLRDHAGNVIDGGAPAEIGSVDLTDGIIGGRLSALQMVQVVGNFTIKIPTDGAPPVLGCNDPLFPTVALGICGNADIASIPAQDFTNQPCDGLSLNLPFRASAAQISTRVVEPPEGGTCPDLSKLCDSD